MIAMKPEWPLYGLCALAGALIGVGASVFGWDDATVSWVGGGALFVLIWTYLPLADRRRGRGPDAHSARG